jgi:hypothetical protein
MARTTSDAIELGHSSHIQTESETEVQRPSTIPEDASGLHHALPPADRGKDAWLVLAAAFILEALVWGESQRQLMHRKSLCTPQEFFRDNSHVNFF